MTTLEEKARAIINNVGEDFNDLPLEERQRISRFLSEQTIWTIFFMIERDKDLTTEAWRKKKRKWLDSCVKTHQDLFGDY